MISKILSLSALILTLTTLINCTTTNPSANRVPAATSDTSSTPHAWSNHPKGSEWSETVQDALSNSDFGRQIVNSNPGDIEQFCPNYNNLDNTARIEFWTLFTSHLADHSSGMDEHHSPEHKDVRFPGNFGLLSLTKGNHKLYKCKSITQDGDYLDGSKNLTCGLKVFATLLYKQGTPHPITGIVPAKSRRHRATRLGLSRYWLQLREDVQRSEHEDSNGSALEEILKATKNSAVCN